MPAGASRRGRWRELGGTERVAAAPQSAKPKALEPSRGEPAARLGVATPDESLVIKKRLRFCGLSLGIAGTREASHFLGWLQKRWRVRMFAPSVPRRSWVLRTLPRLLLWVAVSVLLGIVACGGAILRGSLHAVGGPAVRPRM